MWGRQPKALACLEVKLGLCLYLYIYIHIDVNVNVNMHTYTQTGVCWRCDCRCILSLWFMSCMRRVRDGVSPQPSGSSSADPGPRLVPCPVVPPAQLPR